MVKSTSCSSRGLQFGSHYPLQATHSCPRFQFFWHLSVPAELCRHTHMNINKNEKIFFNIVVDCFLLRLIFLNCAVQTGSSCLSRSQEITDYIWNINDTMVAAIKRGSGMETPPQSLAPQKVISFHLKSPHRLFLASEVHLPPS